MLLTAAFHDIGHPGADSGATVKLLYDIYDDHLRLSNSKSPQTSSHGRKISLWTDTAKQEDSSDKNTSLSASTTYRLVSNFWYGSIAEIHIAEMNW